MHEKGVIQDIIAWKKARPFFYWRLRRRLVEKEAICRITQVQPELNYPQVEAMLRRWFVEDRGATNAYLWEDNRVVVEWLESQLKVSLSPSTLSWYVTLGICNQLEIWFITGKLPEACTFGEHSLFKTRSGFGSSSQSSARDTGNRVGLYRTHNSESKSSPTVRSGQSHRTPRREPSSDSIQCFNHTLFSSCYPSRK